MREYEPYLLLCVLFVTSLSWGIIGIDVGLHWDEPNRIASLTQSIESGILLPRRYTHPSLGYDLTLLSAVPDAVDLLLDEHGRGESEQTESERLIQRVNETPFLLRTRILCLSISMFSLFWVYGIIHTLTGNRWLSLLGPALIASSWEVGYHARWVTADAILMQFTALGILLLVTALQHPRDTRWLYGAAAVAGFSCSTKYPGGILLLPVAAVTLYSRHHQRQAFDHLLRTLLIEGLLFALAFYLITPGAILDPITFVDHVTYEIKHYGSGHFGYTLEPFTEHGRQLLVYLSTVLFSPCAPLALLWVALAMWGIYDLVHRGLGISLALLLLPAVYTAYMISQRVMIIRNYILVVPFLSVWAALGFQRAYQASGQRWWQTGLIALVLLSLLPGQIWQADAALQIANRHALDLIADLDAHLDQHPETAFFLDTTIRKRLATRGQLPANVTDIPHAADTFVFISTEHWWVLKANQRGLYRVISGAPAINFDYYPSWQEPILVSVSLPKAEAMGILP